MSNENDRLRQALHRIARALEHWDADWCVYGEIKAALESAGYQVTEPGDDEGPTGPVGG